MFSHVRSERMNNKDNTTMYLDNLRNPIEKFNFLVRNYDETMQ